MLLKNENENGPRKLQTAVAGEELKWGTEGRNIEVEPPSRGNGCLSGHLHKNNRIVKLPGG